MIRKVKGQIRTVGFDDGTFSFSSKIENRKTILIGVVMKGSIEVVGILARWITVDGTDSTEAIIDAVNSSRFKDLRVIMLKGITYAGFNLVDVERVYEETGLPVIVVIRKKPNITAMENALKKHFPDAEKRISLLKKAPPLVELIPDRLYIQAVGIGREVAEEVVKVTTKTGLTPEPLRLAHMIASAVMTGESKRE
ncbi:endonuclease dU [Thermococcus sp.]